VSVYERLKVLTLALPELGPPAAACVPFVRTGVRLRSHRKKRWKQRAYVHGTTRSAFGVAQTPFGSCVEIDLVAEVL
jgi:enamine deaminase RidA (YjgF/YER057c/UK114 family)